MNEGTSFTGVTVMVKVWVPEVFEPPLAVPPSSETYTDTVAEPLALAAGVKVSAPAAETAGWLLKSALLSFVTVKVTFWEPSPAPAEMAVAHPAMVWATASSSTVWSAPLVKDGASFTPVTVMVKVCVAEVSIPPLEVPPLSEMDTVTVAEPLALAAGV